jgi:hypothetical protein
MRETIGIPEFNSRERTRTRIAQAATWARVHSRLWLSLIASKASSWVRSRKMFEGIHAQGRRILKFAWTSSPLTRLLRFLGHLSTALERHPHTEDPPKES